MKVIAINGIETTNNTHHIPIRGDWYVIHTDPKEYFDGNKLIKNYDFLIDCRYTEPPKTNPNKELILFRGDKHTQQKEIFKKVKELNLTNYQLRTSVLINDTFKSANYSDKMIMKLNYGARSLGLFLIETRPQNQQSTAKALRDLIANEKTLDRLSELEEQFDAVITEIKGKENFEGESIQSSAEQEFILEEFIPGVVSEFRLLVTDRKIVLAQRRDVKDLCVPLGSGESFSDLRFIENMNIRNELYDLIKTGIFNWCSVDLFLTKDKFGIFEYQPQFGTSYAPVEAVDKFYSEMMEYIKVRIAI